MARTLAERLARKTGPPTATGCRLWTGAKNGEYGIIRVNSRTGEVRRVHVVAYELAYRPVPSGLVVMHLCNTKLCVNPSHLCVGTREENTRAAGKEWLCPRGEEWRKRHLPIAWHPRPKDTKTRFLLKVSRSDQKGCRIWLGAKAVASGYGQFKVNRIIRFAHRVAYELFNGPISNGKIVMHTCNVRLCVEPSHLKLGTRAENSEAASLDGRYKVGTEWKRLHPNTIRLRGEDHGGSRLTADQVHAIREMVTGGATEATTAAAFGICQQTVNMIMRAVAWSHLPWKTDQSKRRTKPRLMPERRENIAQAVGPSRYVAAQFSVSHETVNAIRRALR